jgi:predicted PurR-regulated permease PerM
LTGSTDWNPATKRGVAIICGLLALGILYLASSLIPFLIAAGILTFLVEPIISFLVRRVRLQRRSVLDC